MTLTQEQARHAAAMYAALADGKECQRQFDGTWCPWYGETMHPEAFTYRVKPEPEPVVNEWWTNVYLGGYRVGGLYATPELARNWAEKDALETAVHVVRADSIKIAKLVTDEQIEKARWTVRWSTPRAPLLPMLRKFIADLDALREGE